jgi:two-component system NtrC family response regulator
VADAADDRGRIGLNSHPPATAVSQLPAAEITVQRASVNGEARREAIDNDDKGAPVGLAGGEKSQHRAAILYEVSAAACSGDRGNACVFGPFLEGAVGADLARLRPHDTVAGGHVRPRFELVLDRFVISGGDRAVDLATACPVRLRTCSSPSRTDERARARAAARMSAIRIPGVAPLLDFGIDGGGVWVEAYRRHRPRAAGGADEPRPPAATITALMTAAGCAVTPASLRRLAEDGPSSPFLPARIEGIRPGDGSSVAGPYGAGDIAPAAATIIERRDELDAVMEWVASPAEPGARILGIDAPVDAGLRTFFEAIAREARLAGFVPVSSLFCGRAPWPAAGIDGSALSAALRERHVVVLDAPRGAGPAIAGADVACFLSRLDAAGGRPHAVVCRDTGLVGSATFALGPMRDDQLRRSVVVVGIDADRVAQAADQALRQSGGWPGAFARTVRMLLGLRAAAVPYQRTRSGASEVRECAPEPPAATEAVCPSAEYGAAVLARATEMAGRGRHAAAERLLRRTVGYLHRRRRDADQARAQLALGRLLLARGRRSAARGAFEESRGLSDRAQDAAGVVRALVHLGAVHLEDGELAAAESILKTASVGASHAGFRDLRRASELLLARCLFWQGRHDATREILERPAEDAAHGLQDAAGVAERADASTGGDAWGTSAVAWPGPPEWSASEVELRVRTALSRGEVGLAARTLAAAGDARRDREEGPAHTGTLIALRLLIQGALGESSAIASTAASGLALMRRLHTPLAAQEIRLAQLEALIEAGAASQATACLKRFTARPSPAASGLTRLRLEALGARLRQLETAHARPADHADGVVDAGAVLRILQHCHEAHSESDAVSGVCLTLKAALGAGAASAFALTDGAARLIGGSGARPCRPDLAERAAASLLLVGPEDSAAGRELAAPVRYGGAAIGALAVRWAPGASAAGQARARGILAAAAAAVGPAMAALAPAALSKTGADASPRDLGGPSAAMAEIRRQVGRAAAAPYPVLIVGESGTGKELIAKAIHAGSSRRARRFCAVNCAALGDDLFETELFGHARGSFTGAASDRPGLFEEADGGTLFLDEVGELSPRAQAKLLRAIQEGEIRRIGENHPRRVDARIVAATNRSLSDEVKAGRFRHDLLYRLDVLRIVVPPLRERPEDVGPLALAFWREAMRRTGGQAELSSATLAALARYDWPGNVRELQNTLAALAVHAPPRGRVGPSRLPPAIAGAGAHARAEALTLAEARRRFEERFVRATLARAGGQRRDAASALGLSRQGLAKVIARLGIADEGGAA